MTIKTPAPPALNETCELCRSPQRAAFLSMDRLGASMAEIAEVGNFSVEAVQEHFETHVDVRSGSDDANVDQALTDAQELFFAATLANNLAAAASALSVRGRLLNDLRRRQESTGKRKSLLGSADPRNPATWPQELAEFVRQHFDDIIERVTEFEAKK